MKRPKLDKGAGGKPAPVPPNPYDILPDDDDGQSVPRKVKLPPIFTPYRDYSKLLGLMKENNLAPVFKLCSQGTKILTSSLEEYNAVGKLLQQVKLGFYTHDVPGTRPFKVVIRGLPDVTPEEIQDELLLLKLKPIKVFKITRKDQAVKNYRDHLFLVHFERGSTTLKQLQEIRSLLQVIVRWEPYRGSNRPVTQCQKCLGFGHGTRNCYLTPRCPNCGQSHENRECEEAVKCANCGGEHLSTDVNCPARNEFIEVRRKASKPKKTGRPVDPVLQPADFPPLPAPVPNPQPPPQPRPAPALLPIPGFQQVSPHISPHQRAWGEQSTPTTQPKGNIYSPEELVPIFIEMSDKLSACATKVEQIKTLGIFIIRYGR